MKKAFSLLLAFLCAVSLLAPSVLAASYVSYDQQYAADTLHQLGLFNGTGVDAEGRPVYSLDSSATRGQAVTMLVRLLGKESEAKATPWQAPFTDVPDWAKPYVGYAHSKGLVQGRSPTAFDCDRAISAAEFLTLLLRALGYDSSKDFSWDASYLLSDQIGLTYGGYGNPETPFRRGDIASISCRALKTAFKGENRVLLQQLLAENAVTMDQIDAADMRDIADPPATRADLAHFLAANFPIKSYCAQYTYDNLYDVDESTVYAQDILTVFNAGFLPDLYGRSFGTQDKVSLSNFATAIENLLLQSGCDVDALYAPVDYIAPAEDDYYYKPLLLLANLGILTADMDRSEKIRISMLSAETAAKLKALPDSGQIGSQSILEEASYNIEYFELGGKLYKVNRAWNALLIYRVNHNGESALYIRAPLSASIRADDNNRPSSELSLLLSYAIGSYSTAPSDNPYLDGVIAVNAPLGSSGEALPVSLDYSKTYLSATSARLDVAVTYNRHTLSSTDMPAQPTASTYVNNIFYHNKLLNIPDVLDYFGVSKTITIETRDDIQVLCIGS